jgi:hypothetical protein
MTEQATRAVYDEATKTQLIYAFRRIFIPLARILHRAGVPYLEFRDILRDAYVEAAIRDGVPGYQGVPTSTAIAMLVGAPTAEVDRLVDDPSILAPPAETNTALIGAMLTQWSTDAEYQGPYGLPRQLALVERSGKSFSDLVRGIREDADPQQVMTEMLHSGVIEKIGGRHVKMTGRQLVFSQSMAGTFYEELGRAMEELAATINHNQRASADEKLFQRTVFSDQPIPESKLTEFSKLVSKLQQEVLIEIDDWLTKARQRRDDSREAALVDVGVTVFEYHRRPESKAPLGSLVQPSAPSRPGHVLSWEVKAKQKASIK